jgi:hypothetical protein
MDFMLYPTFRFFENKNRFIPVINLPENYKGLIPDFYKLEKEKEIEKYAKLVSEKFGTELKLVWNKKGLIDIGIGIHGGLYLSEQFGIPHFCEHNLETTMSIPPGFVAMKYVSELYFVRDKKLKSNQP